MANLLEEDDEREEEIGTKGNKKGLPIWSVVKNTSLFITLCVFLLTSVLVLDAYKFVSVRHAKFARAKIFQTLQSMDPTIIESHTGMKILTNAEYTQLQSDLDTSRKEARQINSKVQLKFANVLETATAVEKMKKEIEELRSVIEEKEKEAGVSAKDQKPVEDDDPKAEKEDVDEEDANVDKEKIVDTNTTKVVEEEEVEEADIIAKEKTTTNEKDATIIPKGVDDEAKPKQ